MPTGTDRAGGHWLCTVRDLSDLAGARMMTLADAIRLGALIRPQAFGSLFRAGGSCAYGSALEASGAQQYDSTLTTLSADDCGPEGWRLDAFVQCPLCLNGHPGPRWNVITHLNDMHRLTREQIADYVEQWDREAVPAVEQVCAVVE